MTETNSDLVNPQTDNGNGEMMLLQCVSYVNYSFSKRFEVVQLPLSGNFEFFGAGNGLNVPNQCLAQSLECLVPAICGRELLPIDSVVAVDLPTVEELHHTRKVLFNEVLSNTICESPHLFLFVHFFFLFGLGSRIGLRHNNRIDTWLLTHIQLTLIVVFLLFLIRVGFVH